MTSLREIYAAIPSVSCKGLCHDQCTLIPISRSEKDAIEQHTGRRVKTLPQIEHLVMRPADDGTCRYLRRERCTIYEARPLICRLYGASDDLECPHGCRPVTGMLSRDAAGRLLSAICRSI